MKLFSIGGTDIRCSPPLLLLIPAAVIFGREKLLAAAFVSLSVHEAAHALMAARLGFRVSSIEIQPFGFVARTDLRGALPGELAAVYASGPAASLVLASLSSLAEAAIPAYAGAKLGLAEYNLLIFAVNLLPAVPLDGGRLILSAFLSRGRSAALKALKAAGVLTGAVFIALFAVMLAKGYVNPTFALMGGFLTAAAFREGGAGTVGAPRHRRITERRALPVQNIAASKDASLAEAFSMLPQGAYSVLSVVDDKNRRMAELDEYELTLAAALLGASASLNDAVEIMHRRVV